MESVYGSDRVLDVRSERDADAVAWMLLQVDPGGSRLDRRLVAAHGRVRVRNAEVLSAAEDASNVLPVSSHAGVALALLVARDLSDAAGEMRVGASGEEAGFADVVEGLDEVSQELLQATLSALGVLVEAVDRKDAFAHRMDQARETARALEGLSSEQEADLAASIAALEAEAESVYADVRAASVEASSAVLQLRGSLRAWVDALAAERQAAANEEKLGELRRLATFGRRHGVDDVDVGAPRR